MLRLRSTARSPPYSRGLHPVGALCVPPQVLIPLGRSAGVEFKKKRDKVELRPQSTASSRPRSRGLHLVGALCMPPPVLIPLDQIERKKQTTSSVFTRQNTKTTVDCQQSTVVSGTTPSGCTQRAPTGQKIQSAITLSAQSVNPFSDKSKHPVGV